MAIPNNRPLERRPIHPGEILREDFFPEYGLSVTALAEAAGVSRQSMNELLRERRALTPEMALRLSKLFGNSPEFWLNLQRNVDLWDAARGLKREIAHIHPLQVARRRLVQTAASGEQVGGRSATKRQAES
jgi:addiction module HigA family antidote